MANDAERLTNLVGQAGKPDDLAGAIPLDTPIIKALRDFIVQAGSTRMTAMVVVGLGDGGRIAMATVTPGGFIQSYGLIQQALVLIAQQQAVAQSAPPR